MVFSGINQLVTATQFYFYGKQHFTRTGWENNIKFYDVPDVLKNENLKLNDKVYMITGANAGIGREVTDFLASKGASIYMVCRNKERAIEAQSEIKSKFNNPDVHVLVGDCGLESDVRRIWNEFIDHRINTNTKVQLNALICNAGALSNSKSLSSEGVEVTFATHLLFGTYLLGSLALDTLRNTVDSRFIAVSSGGMYNTKFPSWDIVTGSSSSVKYDGQLAYAYAKRGQVLLCERWAEMYADSPVSFVSCHPGWTQTGGVESAYGSSKSYLEPLRSLYEGAEGIVWLAVVDNAKEKLTGGGFYLDRKPQMKHLKGLVFGESSFTKNSKGEIDLIMENLKKYSHVK